MKIYPAIFEKTCGQKIRGKKEKETQQSLHV